MYTYLYRERERQTDRQTDREREGDEHKEAGLVADSFRQALLGNQVQVTIIRRLLDTKTKGVCSVMSHMRLIQKKMSSVALCHIGYT